MTIVRQRDVARSVTPEHAAERFGRAVTLNLSDGGGITQYGVYHQTLDPGARSDRHWHEQEDEFLYLLSGELTVIENDGPHTLGPGDAACWPAGVPNAHAVENRSDAPCSFLIAGTRPENDRCHYPDLGRTQIDEGRTWSIVEDATGRVLKGGVRD